MRKRSRESRAFRCSYSAFYILGWEERRKLFVLYCVAFTWGLAAQGSFRMAHGSDFILRSQCVGQLRSTFAFLIEECFLKPMRARFPNATEPFVGRLVAFRDAAPYGRESLPHIQGTSCSTPARFESTPKCAHSRVRALI